MAETKTNPKPKDPFGPPPAKKGSTSPLSVYEKYIAAHPRLKAYSQVIAQAAKDWGIDATYFASLINFESGGRLGAASSKGALGLGQVLPTTAAQFPLYKITAHDLTHDPKKSVQAAAWYFAQGFHGDYAKAYTQHYNPGYTGPGPFQDIPKGYVVVGGTSPADRANQTAATAQAKAQQPALAKAAAAAGMAPYFLAYAGRLPTSKEVAQFTGVSSYQITNYLSDPKNNPRLFKSPIWLTHGPQYEALYKGVYGPNAKVDKEALLYGIVHNLDSSSFHQLLVDGKIPGQAPYTTSEEFKGNLANFTSVYSNIYGRPDAHATQFLKSAVLGGWNQAQVESYLRSKPEYRSSGEYKARAIDLASSMGLVSGDMAKAVKQTALSQPSPQPDLPVPQTTPPPATTTAAATKRPVTPGGTPAPDNAGGVLSG